MQRVILLNAIPTLFKMEPGKQASNLHPSAATTQKQTWYPGASKKLHCSDYKDHNTTAAFAFLKAVIEHLHYFTDGCSGQYENKNNRFTYSIGVYVTFPVEEPTETAVKAKHWRLCNLSSRRAYRNSSKGKTLASM